jgi:hypothetical protein
MKSFQQLVQENHAPSVAIDALMQTPAYTSLEITAETTAVKRQVSDYFLKLFGNKPAVDTVHNMNVSRGGSGTPSEYL